ncbi:hypothetical protein FKM82_030484 [Ascaphus truei]
MSCQCPGDHGHREGPEGLGFSNVPAKTADADRDGYDKVSPDITNNCPFRTSQIHLTGVSPSLWGLASV